jgi:prepilin-type N-terminal cleavage/methylation domain-containing protein
MKRVKQIHGFTLLEILTAMAVVAIMIGLLIPAIGAVQKMAQTVKQKSQFNAIEMALEAFRTDWGEDYPPSSYTRNGDPAPTSYVSDGYCGAQKLAEAIIGMDGFGFHPKSQWRSDGLQDTDGNGTGDVPLYIGAAGYAALTPTEKDENIKARKGPYLELEKANAVKINSLYLPGHDVFSALAGNTFVLCDMFGTAKNLSTSKKTGMPILYFRADTNNILHEPTTLGIFPWASGANSTSPDAIYNVNENSPFLNYSPPWGNISHPMGLDRSLFYKRIWNPNFTSPQRPYRAQSFIMLSAGADGLYGTLDDVYNIDENDK